MKLLPFITISLALAACGGLSKEQREQMKDGMKSAQIRRVTEVQLFEETTRRGKELVSVLSGQPLDKVDSLSKANRVSIHWIEGMDDVSAPKLAEVVKAYQMGARSGALLEDNLQKSVTADTLYYTSPVMKGDSLVGIWSIVFLRKEVIRAMD